LGAASRQGRGWAGKEEGRGGRGKWRGEKGLQVTVELSLATPLKKKISHRH